MVPIRLLLHQTFAGSVWGHARNSDRHSIILPGYLRRQQRNSGKLLRKLSKQQRGVELMEEAIAGGKAEPGATLKVFMVEVIVVGEGEGTISPQMTRVISWTLRRLTPLWSQPYRSYLMRIQDQNPLLVEKTHIHRVLQVLSSPEGDLTLIKNQ